MIKAILGNLHGCLKICLQIITQCGVPQGGAMSMVLVSIAIVDLNRELQFGYEVQAALPF